jgi:hypothetical protein
MRWLPVLAARFASPHKLSIVAIVTIEWLAFAMKANASVVGAIASFGLGAFFGYFGLLVFLEFYESQRPIPRSENRRDRKLMNRCALWGAFIVGLISISLYLSR